ncbi:TetR/AcrR family transcriptional regulator [Protofrankia symbiont of Coriaria ruscifolia]|uniref:Regulatory protein TetR n=1 Tax=Candidatus Protofrankia californiensis TaxID=1839754 RepID=A0A1C3NYN4_9ACTN|nr:TetR/AcrR family transcriptional regulator [Protofrankia symbiont of Coriaria ruscifolia]SBW22628.1 regulatory protein TetR [Candidatus Protofrankia californiensis]
MTVEARDDPAPTRAQQRRERERAAARESILSAARELARSEGWDAVTMRRLAERIDYSANFAYRYFTGRDDILLALVRDGFTRLRETMDTASKQPMSGSATRASGTDVAAIRRAAHAYLDFALTEPDLYQLMYGLGGVRVPAADTWVEGQAVGDVLTGLLAAAGDRQPEQHVLQLWATAHGLIALLAVGRVDVDSAALHALLEDALTDCLTRALPTPAASPRRGTRSTGKRQL